MSKIWILIRAQLINFFPINEIREPRNKKQSSVVIASFGIITLAIFFCVYNIMTAKTLVQVGQQELIPAYMIAVSSFSILFLTIFYTNGILFGSRDMETLLSLPLKSSDIISSKFMFMYLLNFLIGFIFMLPGGIVWVLNGNLNVLQIILYFTSMIFVPLIPMCIAACMGIIVVAISSYFKRKNVIALIFSFAMIGIIGYIAVSAMKSGNEDSIEIMLSKQITELYPISGLFMQHTNFSMYIGDNGNVKIRGNLSHKNAFENLVQVSAYGDHAVGLKKDGTVVSNESNDDVSKMKSIQMIAAGHDHILALKKDGTVVCSGNDNACAVSDWKNVKRVYAGKNVSFGVQGDGKVLVAGDGSEVKGMSGVQSIRANDQMIVIVRTEGRVQVIAKGKKEVPNGSHLSGVKDVALTQDGIFAIDQNHKIQWSLVNEEKTSFDKATLARWQNIRFIAGQGDTLVGIDQNGRMTGIGDNSSNQYENTAPLAEPQAKKLGQVKNIKFTEKENLGTVIYIAFDGQYIGNILISDEIKADSPKAIKGMKANGIKEIVMLTGDNNAIGKNIAQKLGNSELGVTIEKALTNYMQNRMTKIIVKFMNQVMIAMEKRLGSQLGSGVAMNKQMARAFKSAFMANPAVFAKAFS